MKHFTITFLLIATCFCGFSQKKFTLGAYLEGGYFFPKDLKQTVSGGGGLYLNRPILKNLSVSLLAGYRYETNEDKFSRYITQTMSENFNLTFNQHYLVLPAKIKYNISNKAFMEGGIEAAWLLNYDIINKKPEYSWLIGFGYNINQLKASINFVQGLTEQGMGPIKYEGKGYGQILRNRMFIFSISHPINFSKN